MNFWKDIEGDGKEEADTVLIYEVHKYTYIYVYMYIYMHAYIHTYVLRQSFSV